MSSKASSYARLLKLNVPELSLFPLVAFGLMSNHIDQLRYWAVMLAFLAFSACCSLLTITLDDIVGYLDGVDQQTNLERKQNISKPLLSGELSLTDAWRAGGVLLGLAWLWMLLLTQWGPSPVLAWVLLTSILIVVTQYSYGLKLSYIGLGELVVLYGIAMTIMVPTWLLTGELTIQVVWVALMSGLPYAAQIVVSNLVDRRADARASRYTLTVLVGARRAPWISAALLALFWVAYGLGLARGLLPWSSLAWLLLLPGHMRFIQLAMTGRPALARLLSFRLIRLQLVLFVLVLGFVNYYQLP